jgi:hypothetical protein
MSNKIKNTVKKNLNTLLETKGFEDMEVAFGIKEKSDNLSAAEKKQFGSMETIQDKESGVINLGDAPVQPELNKVHKEDLKDAEEYYKMVLDRMRNFQKTSESEPSQIGESFIKEEGDDYIEKAIDAAKKMYEYIKSNNIPTRIDIKGKPEGEINNYNFLIIANPSESNGGEIKVFGRGSNEDVIKNYVNHVKDKFNKEYGDLFDSSDIYTEKQPNGLITMSFKLVKKRAKMSESFESPKVNRKDDQLEDEDVYDIEALGPGMLALKYDNEGTPVHKKFEERMEEMNGDDLTYKKLRAYSEKYLKHKYEKPEEYHKTPKVRVTSESKVGENYSDVIKENIFKVKGEIKSKEQVLKLVDKLPNRVKIDESEFAITDGENYYKLIWEGSTEDGEAVIIREKNTKLVNESIDKMKDLWSFNSSDKMTTKKNIKEGNDDVFFKMMNKVRGK